MNAELNSTSPLFCGCAVPFGSNGTASPICERCGLPTAGALATTIDSSSTSSPAQIAILDDLIGKSLDHFTVISKLGQGSMGQVYKAMDESLQRLVALKIIPASSILGDSKQLDQLLREARAQARVNHPHVVHIYYISRDVRRPYVAMELVDGVSLSNCLESGPLTYDKVTEIGLQIAEALRETSKFSIVHGDIKPSNILLSDQVAKLSDFGLARGVADQTSARGRISGTPNYMSPEACRGDAPTIQSDMYSFGVMLFEMTFGSLPYSYTDTTIKSRLEAHQFRAPEFPEKWPAKIPGSWKAFLQILLNKDAARRFPTWNELVTYLQLLRPYKPVPAGGLPRGIAWGLDLLILFLLQLAMLGVTTVLGSQLANTSVTNILCIFGVLIVPLAVMWWMSRGGLSPGKSLMQLRVVDQHGLALHSRTLAIRSLFPLLPIWLLPTGIRIGSVGLPYSIMLPLWLGIWGFLLVDVIWAIACRGRSLHDDLLHTRVVLASAPRQAK